MTASFTGRHVRPSAKSSQEFARHNLVDGQLTLVHEDAVDVVRSLVAALGGAKVIGPRLFPHKPAEAAARYLLDCLNPHRDHDIGVEGFVILLKWAREAGVHLGTHWLCDELGYTRPQPIEPEDQAAEILRRVDKAREELRTCLQQLDRLPGSGR